MRVSPAVMSNSVLLYSTKSNGKNNLNFNKSSNFLDEPKDNVSFKAKAGKIIGKATGAAVGAAAGGAIIGGGSLATGLAMLSGPIGWAVLGAAYLVGGAIAGGYVGDGIGDAIEDKINENNNNG